MIENGWKVVYYESDDNDFLLMPYGNFKRCTACGMSLPQWCEGKDPEHILYHGYCSRKCATEHGYGNYVTRYHYLSKLMKVKEYVDEHLGKYESVQKERFSSDQSRSG